MLFYSRLRSGKRSGDRPRREVLADASWRATPTAHLLRPVDVGGPGRAGRTADGARARVRAPHASYAPTFRNDAVAARPPAADRGPPEARGDAVAAAILEAGGLDASARGPSDADLARTLRDFLRLYGGWGADAGFSVRHGGRRVGKSPDRHGLLGASLFIEDPLDPGNNVGRASYDVQRALALFASRHEALRDALLVLPAPSSSGEERAGFLDRLLDDGADGGGARAAAAARPPADADPAAPPR
jgi:hypothetical protein